MSQKLTIQFASPLLRNHISTLDATLGGMLYDDGVDGAEAGRCPLIDRWSPAGHEGPGVPMASLMFLPDECQYGETPVTRMISTSQRKNQNLLIDMATRDSVKAYSKSNHHRIPNTIASNTAGSHDSHNPDYILRSMYGTIHAEEISYIFSGDAHAIISLIKRHGYVGTRTATGFGAVADVRVEDIDTDIPGILHRGKLVRPIPTWALPHLPETGHRIVSGMWHNPYNPRDAVSRGYTVGRVAEPRMVLTSQCL